MPRLDFDKSIAQAENKNMSGFSLSGHLKGIQPNNLLAQFPFRTYIDSANYDNIAVIKNDLLLLDSVNAVDKMLNLQVLMVALTDSLKKKHPYIQYNPDSLIHLIQWVEKFKNYAAVDTKNALLFESVYDYWMSFVVGKLNAYYEANNKLKYEFRFRYLVNRCNEQRYGTNIGNTKFDKIVLYFADQNWTYLVERFNNGTGLFFKLLIYLFVLFTCYAYYSIFKLHFKRKKDEKNT